MATRPQKPQRHQGNRPSQPSRPTQIHGTKHPHLYVQEHLEAKHLDVPRLAGRLGQHEKSVYRSLREQSRIWKEIELWAEAIGLEDWRDLTMPPDQPSVDARINRLPQEFREVILRAVGKG